MNSYPSARPRRLRTSPALRRLVAQTSLEPRQLVLPVFVADGITEPQPIPSMPGVVQHTRDSLRIAAHEAVSAGIGGIMLFGVPRKEDKDAYATAAIHPQGILNKALTDLTHDLGNDIVIMADTCLDAFTDHGHCGLINNEGQIDNDATLLHYVSMALAQAEAGAHVIGLSGMMDGQVRKVRTGLDAAGYTNTAILAYSAKFSSALYGPFRQAVNSSLIGDRRTYQQDLRNPRDARRQILLDLDAGADIIMVKPGLGYLDIVALAASLSTVPVAVYQVSGEYSMISAAAAQGWIDGPAAVLESLWGLRRAGADIIMTYWAIHVAGWLS